MRMSPAQLLKPIYKVVTIADFVKHYHDDRITKQTVSNAIKSNRIDYVKFGYERLIVLTKRTKSWSPRILK